jgi:hypothetical protein
MALEIGGSGGTVGALAKANNLSDVASAATALTNLGGATAASVTAANTAITTLQTTVASLQTTVASLQTTVASLQTGTGTAIPAVSGYASQTYLNHTNPFVNSFGKPLPAGTVMAPGSAAMVTNLVNGISSSGYGLGINRQPVFVVPSTQPLVAVSGTTGNTGGHVPIPTAAQSLSSGTDLPLVIFQPAADKVWEVWEADYTGGAWTAGNAGVITGATDSLGVFTDGSGVAASGISYGALIITQADVASGTIAHAVALYLSNNESTQYWPPAARADSGATSVAGQVAEGMWFRFPTSMSMPSGLAPLAQMIFTAIQTYGCVLHDRSDGSYFAAEDTATWASGGGTGTDPITTACTVAGTVKPDYSVVANIPISSLVQIVPPVIGYPAQAAPSAPTAVTLTPENSALGVSWTAPSSPTTILFSVVTYVVHGSGSIPTVLAPNPTGTAATISGLTSGTAYDVVVYAVNADSATSTGTLSAGSTVVTGTPTGAGTGGGSATVAQTGTFTALGYTNTTATYNVPATTAGRVLVLADWNQTGGSATSQLTGITGGPTGGTWTKVTASYYTSSVYSVGYWVCTGYSTSAASTITLTYSGGPTYPSVQVFECSGVVTPSPVDTANATDNEGSGTTIIASTLTPGAPGDLLIAIGWAESSGVDATSPSWSNNSGVGSPTAWQWEVATAGSPTTAQWTVSYGGGVVSVLSLKHA